MTRKFLGNVFGAILRVYRLFRSLVLNFLFIIFAFILFGALFSTQDYDVPVGAALVIAPEGQLVEQETAIDPAALLLGGNPVREVLLHNILDAIDYATTDNDISAIVLVLNGLEGGDISKLRDIATALDEFKTTGKKVYAVSDSYSQGQYFLATHADEIILNPMGGVALEGFGTYQMYYGEALANLDININVFRVGDFKSAVEPFTSTEMSPEAKANNRAWLEEFWRIYVQEVSRERALAADLIVQLIENYDQELARFNGDTAQLALEVGLVDTLASRTQTRDYLRMAIGGNAESDTFAQVDLRTYLGARRANTVPGAGDEIGIIVASGIILDGWQGAGAIGGDSLSQLIRQAAKDESIKALVLRIDSPGGSEFASEVIRDALVDFKQTGKPLVVSMGSVAASGGYWIATPADQIWATSTTLTGSIGIFAIYPTFGDTLARLGIHTDGIGTTTQAGAFIPGRELPLVTRNAIQEDLQYGYQRFLNIVADARDMTPGTVDEIAQGQVWSASAARNFGLLDNIGNLDDAVAAASGLADLEQYNTRFLTLPLSPGEQLLRSLTESFTLTWAAELVGKSGDGPFQSLYRRVHADVNQMMNFNDPRGMYLHCFACAMY